MVKELGILLGYALMFIPAAVGLLTVWQGSSLFYYLIIIIIFSTIIVMVLQGEQPNL